MVMSYLVYAHDFERMDIKREQTHDSHRELFT